MLHIAGERARLRTRDISETSNGTDPASRPPRRLSLKRDMSSPSVDELASAIMLKSDEVLMQKTINEAAAKRASLKVTPEESKLERLRASLLQAEARDEQLSALIQESLSEKEQVLSSGEEHLLELTFELQQLKEKNRQIEGENIQKAKAIESEVEALYSQVSSFEKRKKALLEGLASD